MKKINLFLLFTALIYISCDNNASKEVNSSEEVVLDKNKTEYPSTLSKGLAAHGGIDRWSDFKTISYDLVTTGNRQNQLIELSTRKVRITDSLFVLGYDGQQVWVSPDLASFGNGSARFYHNLYFYFFAMPYVLADPGINYEELGEQVINGKTYNAVKVSYNQGVGDSPEDFYVAHFNTETDLMELLLYTVTYYSKESHEKYNALIYEWQEVQGLQVAKSIKGYKYDSGKLGEQRYESKFDQVIFSKENPSDTLFSIPNIAEIDSLRQ